MGTLFLLWKSRNTVISTVASALVIFPGIALIVWYDDIIIQGISSITGPWKGEMGRYDPRLNIAFGLFQLSLGLIMLMSRITAERKRK